MDINRIKKITEKIRNERNKTLHEKDTKLSPIILKKNKENILKEIEESAKKGYNVTSITFDCGKLSHGACNFTVLKLQDELNCIGYNTSCNTNRKGNKIFSCNW